MCAQNRPEMNFPLASLEQDMENVWELDLSICLVTKVDIWTWSCLIIFFMPCSVLSMVSIPIIAAPERPRCMRHNIHGPWIVDGVYFHSCLILSYGNITSTLSHFTVDSCRFLESLSSGNYLPVLLVSIFLLNSSQLANHAVENEQKQLVIMSSTSNIIYWDECSIHHPASSWIPSLREVGPLSSRQISISVSLLDPEWRNLMDSISLESIISSKGQFASSKLSINRET